MITLFKYNRQRNLQSVAVRGWRGGSAHGAWLLGGRGVLMGERMVEAGPPPDMAPPPVGDPELMFDIRP